MKSLFQNHSYNMVKMFLNQFATAIFGFSLALAAGKAENPTLRNVTSICAILFYLFLLYTMTWEIGFRERVSVLHGKIKNQPYKGALISLIANLPNLIFAIFIMLGMLVQNSFCGALGAFGKTAALLLEGMYTGILAHPVNGTPLNQYWFMYFIILIPAILVCGIAYFLGLKDIKFTALFNQEYPESDREPKQKK
ncbi:MAG: hypothetical protein IJW16_02060 [Clostridia bacterium]|nr:hypothetical protein [Clostridia bacterium]